MLYATQFQHAVHQITDPGIVSQNNKFLLLLRYSVQQCWEGTEPSPAGGSTTFQ